MNDFQLIEKFKRLGLVSQIEKPKRIIGSVKPSAVSMRKIIAWKKLHGENSRRTKEKRGPKISQTKGRAVYLRKWREQRRLSLAA